MDNRSNEIKEETPEYRSVMIRPLAPPPMPMPRSLGPLSKSPAGVSHSGSQTKPSNVARWQIPSAPALPAHYPLGRTNVYVQCSAQEVADRICSFMRKESVSVTYDDEDKSVLRAETLQCLKYSVRLFEDQGSVVVELQRTAGCGFQFKEAAKGVVRSAKGISSAPKRRFPMPSGLPRPNPEEKSRRIEEGLNIASRMLMSNRKDQELMGLESLASMTSSIDSCLCAEKIFAGDILNKLVAIAFPSPQPFTDSEDRMAALSKRNALAVVTNCLERLANSGKLSLLLSASNELIEAHLTDLVECLRASREAPHEALYASRCLQHLSTVAGVQSLLSEMDVDSAVSMACSVGCESNQLLEREAKKLESQLLQI